MEKATADVMFSSASVDWWTPPHIIELAEQVMYGIELDPASPGKELSHVPARRHFTIEDDGLKQPWLASSTFLNPPYGRSIGLWVRKLVFEVKRGHVLEAIALLPSRTDTAWFRELEDDFIFCFIHKRLKFWTVDGPIKDAAPFPSVLVYTGPHPDRFAQYAGEIGSLYIQRPSSGQELSA